MKFEFALIALLAVGCSNSSKVVNKQSVDYPTLPWNGSNGVAQPGPANPNDQKPSGSALVVQENNMKSASVAAVTGSVVLKAEIPTPVSRIAISLQKQENGNWKEISSTNSEPDGSFRFTLRLTSGQYRILVPESSKLYSGLQEFSLTDKPIKNMIFEVTAKNSKAPSKTK